MPLSRARRKPGLLATPTTFRTERKPPWSKQEVRDPAEITTGMWLSPRRRGIACFDPEGCRRFKVIRDPYLDRSEPRRYSNGRWAIDVIYEAMAESPAYKATLYLADYGVIPYGGNTWEHERLLEIVDGPRSTALSSQPSIPAA